jgi:hypothetical protein
MAEISVPRFLNRMDALVWLAAHPLPPPIAAALADARRADVPAREPRTAPHPAPKAPTQPLPLPQPPAAEQALFSGAYAGEIYARRLRVVMALQAEVQVAADALAERYARGRS